MILFETASLKYICRLYTGTQMKLSIFIKHNCRLYKFRSITETGKKTIVTICISLHRTILCELFVKIIVIIKTIPLKI